MISAGDFKNGLTIELEGNVYQIVDFQHVKPGKGAGFVRTKMKNIKNGGVVEKTFRPTEKFPPAHIERTDMQYLYTDGDLYYFMDVETFDQIALNEDMIGDSLKFVRENDMVKMISHNGDIFAVEPPIIAPASPPIKAPAIERPAKLPVLVEVTAFICPLRTTDSSSIAKLFISSIDTS